MNNFPFAPPQASEHAYNYDFLFWTITGLTVFFTMIVVCIVGFMVTRYRKGSKASRRGQIDGHLGLEITWTAIPLVLAVIIFGWSTRQFMQQRAMPKDGIEIFVIGKQWMWHVQHMNGIRENNEMHVPVGVPVKVTMISQDVLHALFLPDFRTQFHVVPGRYTDLHFTPTKVGVYKMLCAMHCGAQHSEMVGKVYVMSQEDYARWMATGGNRFEPAPMSMAKAGELLFKNKGCSSCHNDQDNDRAPSLYGLIGRTRAFTNGTSAVADEDYVRESVLEPYDRVTKGYINTMPAYKGQLTEEQVRELIEYIKSLGRGSAGNGTIVPYEQPEHPSTVTPGEPDNTTSIANKRRSAGATHFEQTGDHR